jgi:hypothetical protein
MLQAMDTASVLSEKTQRISSGDSGATASAIMIYSGTLNVSQFNVFPSFNIQFQ